VAEDVCAETKRPNKVLEGSAKAAVEACCRNWRRDGIVLTLPV
jgi:hypothetical protein